jgi:hypothetical protein
MVRRRDAFKNLLYTFSKVPFFIDESQRNLYHLFRMLRMRYVHSFKEISQLEGEMLPRWYIIKSVMCPSLLTDPSKVLQLVRHGMKV